MECTDSSQDACGVCGSDVHTITGGWGEVPLPICVGHEVIGKAIKVGDKVSTVKVGDRVGVGAQIAACLECKQCRSDNENYCPKQIGPRYRLPMCGQRGLTYLRYLRCSVPGWNHLSRWLRQPYPCA